MIKVTVFAQPRPKVHTFTGVSNGVATDGKGRSVDILQLLIGLSDNVHRYRWEIDFSSGTEEERQEWRKWDLSVRLVRACAEGRPVHFDGQVYREKDPKVLDRIINRDPRPIAAGQDDESGLHLVAWTESGDQP